MTYPIPPPFDTWHWLQACQQTWLAGLDPLGTGARLRAQRLDALIDDARRRSPLYARRAAQAKTLADFEPVGKALLMQHFDDWATDRRITRDAVDRFIASQASVAEAWLGRYLVWTSSGTSGQPGIFVQDAASLAAIDAIDALRLRSADPMQPGLGLWGWGRRFAYVGAIGGPYAGNVNLLRLQRIAPALCAPHIDRLSVLEPLARLAERLQVLQPDVLITYPSCAMALAHRQASGSLSLRLAELWLGGEQLSAAQRKLLGDTFGCPVRNSYGASEFYSIAFECGHGRLHLNDDWVMLEGVDAQGRMVPVGEFSHSTLLTNLANRVQPLIRYELTDRVRFVGQSCACGCAFPVIEVQGRSDDTLSLPGLDGSVVTLLPLALETVIEEQAEVTHFQLLLRQDGVLELRLPADIGDVQAAAQRCRRALLGYFTLQGLAPPSLVLGQDDPLRRPGSGKLGRVINQLHPPAVLSP